MRGVQVNDTRRTGRSVAVQALKLLQAGNREQLNQSKIWCEEGSTLCGQEEAELPEVLQEILWKQFFADTAKWWDNRRSKPTPRHPDFRHKESKVPLWLDNRHKPPWVDSQLASLDAGSKTRSELSAQQLGALEGPEGHLELVVCTKLCAEGFISDAVDALDVFVQRGCSVPSNLFYRIIKSCIQNKELALGQRVHALTVRAGYEGDAFLATHLIGLYASHGKLEQAMGVFSKVSTPDAYNWATIISAYARHGEAAEAAEAIRLYRQMYESTTIQPDDCLYSAVLKACAAARDLVAGKDVHAHIVACSRQLNRLCQAGDGA